jgi:hypothetical protein
MAMSKMYMGIKLALESINNGGAYEIIEGSLYNGEKKLGSLDKKSGNIYYVIKGIDIVASRLHYAYHNGGIDSLLDGHGIHFLDGDRTNLQRDNLVQLPRKGYKKALEELRTGLSCPLELSQATPMVELTPEEQATALLQKGEQTIKEIAEATGLKYKKVWGMKRKMQA